MLYRILILGLLVGAVAVGLSCVREAGAAGYRLDVLAAGRVNGADGSCVAAGMACRGATVARAGAGDYTITLDRECDTSECVILASAEVDENIVQVVHTSDSVKRVTQSANTGGAATDGTFGFLVLRFSGGAGR